MIKFSSDTIFRVYFIPFHDIDVLHAFPQYTVCLGVYVFDIPSR